MLCKVEGFWRKITTFANKFLGMKKFLFSILALFCTMNIAIAQSSAEEREKLKQEIKNEIVEELKAEVETKQDKAVSFKPYGFIRNYACFDTRECQAVMG